MCGFDLESSIPSSDFVAAARERNLLIHSAGPHTIRIIPPLTITLDELDAGLGLLEDTLRSFQ